MGREQLEILRLAAGLWYTERRYLITSLHLLLRVYSVIEVHLGIDLALYLLVNIYTLFSI